MIDWNTSLEFLKGIGPARWNALNSIQITTVKELYLRFPKRYFDKTSIVNASELRKYFQQNVSAIGKLKVIQEVPLLKSKHKRMLKVFLEDDTNVFQIVFYEGISIYKNSLELDHYYLITGKVTGSDTSPTFIHPRIEKIADDSIEVDQVESKVFPIYSMNDELKKTGLTSKGIQNLLERLFESIEIPEVLDENFRNRNQLPSLREAIKYIHFPKQVKESEIGLNYFIAEELFYFQLAMLVRRISSKKTGAPKIHSVGNKTNELLNILSFELTNGQRKVLNEIYLDLNSNRPMLRLLQGDVGSGKTIVAVLSMVMVVEAGYQCALMAPTEVLAEQHFLSNIEKFEAIGVKCELLVSGLPTQKKRELLNGLSSGEIDVIVGTHALIQHAVKFKNLGMAVIDEQHRFGVEQRKVLTDKGNGVHLLVMTATPIPRTLSLTLYGDLDVSLLTEKPASRAEITTIAISPNQRRKVLNLVRENAFAGFQSYIVFPIVDETETSDLRAAVDEYQNLIQNELKDVSVGILHGKMPLIEKNEALKNFSSGQTKVLITTTVVEVGVDVAKATIMVIEHAERFGLSQLHQLRGRVGRSHYPSKCILIVYQYKEISKERIQAILKSQDGFELSEIDFNLRGSGELFGIKQHGLTDFKYADLVKHRDWVLAMRNEALLYIETKPELRSKQVWQELKNRYSGKISFGGIA